MRPPNLDETVLTDPPAWGPLIQALVVAPVMRIVEAPIWGKLWGFVMAGVTAVLTDVSTGIIVLLVIASAGDWYWGRQAAKVQGRFQAAVSAYGLQSKISQVFLLLLIRAFEAWIPGVATFIDTRGVLTTALATFAFAQEIESIQANRLALGARPWPMFDRALGLIRASANRLFPSREDDGPEQ